MFQRVRLAVILIVELAVVIAVIALVNNTGLFGKKDVTQQESNPRQSWQALLRANGCPSAWSPSRLEGARKIIENRLNGLGIANPVVQIQGECQIKVVLPAVDNPTLVINAIRQTGHLEIVDAGKDAYTEGTIIRTSGNPSPTLPYSSLQLTLTEQVYEVIVTGAEIDVNTLHIVIADQPEVGFTLTPSATQKFGQFTTTHNEATSGGQPYYLCIVLDNRIESCPSIRTPIPNGQVVITSGHGGRDEANRLISILSYGALPIELQLIQNDAHQSMPQEMTGMDRSGAQTIFVRTTSTLKPPSSAAGTPP